MKTITVFTPTYNRAHILHNCYESLLRQTNKDFEWLIIDDGSTDNTKDLVNIWKAENQICIRYIYQENQGMHGAHNTAHLNSNTLLTVCCDSDDYLADNAIETIIEVWEEKSTEKTAGIIGHDADIYGDIKVQIPEKITHTTLYDLRYKYNLRGDFKLVYRTQLLQKELYPIIDGEDYLAVGYKYFLIDQDYELIVTNQILCFVDYQEDGITSNKIKKYITSPKGFMYYRLKMIPIMHNFPNKLWQSIHYISSAIFAKDKAFLSKTDNKLIVMTALPFGILLNMYIRIKSVQK